MSQSNLCFFKPKTQINVYAFIVQQQELYKGLIQNPSKELYGGIIELSPEIKTQIQAELRKFFDGDLLNHPMFPFSLAFYLKGYTYYDLLKEAAIATLLGHSYPEDTQNLLKKNINFLWSKLIYLVAPLR